MYSSKWESTVRRGRGRGCVRHGLPHLRLIFVSRIFLQFSKASHCNYISIIALFCINHTSSSSVQSYRNNYNKATNSSHIVVSLLAHTSMASFISQVMEPGGGLLLLPFVRFVIGCLLVLTTCAAVMNVARIHMIILTILSTGLFISLHWFETEFRKLRNRNSSAMSTSSSASTTTSTSTYSKTKNTAANSNNNKTD